MADYLIGIGHQSRVGKDTCGNFIASVLAARGLSNSVKVASFAEPLKAVTAWLFGHRGVRGLAYYEENPERRNDVIPGYGGTVVDLWIAVGRKMREVYPDVWLEATLSEYERGSLIIRDVRFPNEAEAIRERGGTLIKVTRPGQVVRGSDAEIPDDYAWDYVIQNTGTIEELRNKCRLVVDSICRGKNG
jgi:hypothetical protein